MFKRLRDYFKSKTREQIFSLTLLVTCVVLIILCAIARCLGILWFAADLNSININNVTIQIIVKSCLLIFEITFTYKILCKVKFIYCFLFAVIETTILGFIPNHIVVLIVQFILYFGLPILITKDKFSLLDSLILFIITNLYSAVFCYGRFGNVETYYAYSYIHGVLSTIDYKLLFVAIYLIIKNFGGIRLWKNQKRLLFQTKQNPKK